MSRANHSHTSTQFGKTTGGGLQIGKWECPICGETRQFYRRPGNSHKTPIGGLRNHLRSSLDEEHGGDSFPEIHDDSDTLQSFITLQE